MNGSLPALSVARYNEVLRSPMVLAIFRHFARLNLDFSSSVLVAYFSQLETFPLFTARSLLAAAEAAGVTLRGEKIEFSDLDSCTTPFLTYVESADPDNDQVQLMEILSVGDRGATMASGAVGTVSITRKKLREMWTGIVFTAQDRHQHVGATELDVYRSRVRILPAFISSASCDSIMSYCESQVFRRSQVTKLDAENQTKEKTDLRVRNSSSAPLFDRNRVELADIYRRVSALENTSDQNIELIQCVRYKAGQKFSSHFDSGNGVDRRATYLLYLNDSFKGGQTYFPMLGLAVEPRAGECLQFPSCDEEGRIFWQSEHIGTTVTSGVKYALNIWVRRSPDL